MRIGYVNPEYGARRNIIGCCSECDYIRVRSFKSAFEKIKAKVGLSTLGLSPYYFCGGFAADFRKVDLYHFWNNVALWPCKTPYITSFEAELPRKFVKGALFDRAVKSLLSNQCRHLIAFSEYAKNTTLEYARLHGFSEISRKISVHLPPQELLCTSKEINMKVGDFKKKGGVRLVFCGKDFFRKGGSEIVKALLKVRKEFEVEAFLIGDYEHVDYASSWDVDSADEMRTIFANNEGWLHHYKSMNNQDMLSLAKTCHIGLLPTRHDTFGYSLLEFQACGLPCITTDVCSLPEVNNNDVGWMIKACESNDERVGFSTPDKLKGLSRIIESGLVTKLCEALSKPDIIIEKGIRAIESISKNHSPEKYGDFLGVLYEKASWSS